MLGFRLCHCWHHKLTETMNEKNRMILERKNVWIAEGIIGSL